MLHSYGYAAECDLDERRAEGRLLFTNLGLILDHAEEILTTPEYFFCQLRSAFMSVRIRSTKYGVTASAPWSTSCRQGVRDRRGWPGGRG